jgi:hypothetical protein
MVASMVTFNIFVPLRVFVISYYMSCPDITNGISAILITAMPVG